MPINFLSIPGSSHKKCKLTILFALSPLFFFAQSLTGLWVGALSNDSTTIRKDQSFEIALTEYRGKVYGYSRSEFIVDDVLYFIVKRVKGTIEGDICEVTDDEIMSYNFPKKLDKNVKVSSIFRRDKNDSTWQLDGKWKTNSTKKYYSVSGKVELEQEKDLTASKIFPHLEELKLADEIVFYKDRKEGQPIVKIAKPEKVYTESVAKTEQLSSANEIAATTNNTIVKTAAPTIIPAKPSFNNSKGEAVASKEKTVVSTEKNIENENTVVTVKTNSNPVVTNSVVIENKNPEITAAKENSTVPTKATTVVISNSVAEKKEIKTEPVAVAQKSVVIIQPDIVSVKPDVKNNTTVTVKTNTPVATKPIEEKKEVKAEPIAKIIPKQDASITKPQPQTTIKQPEVNSVATTTNKPEIKKQEATNTIAVKPTTIATTVITPEKKEVIDLPVYTEIKRTRTDITLKAALIDGRKSEFSQIVNFKSDSLQISLYDNGEIDGDTVSVFMNGEVLLSKQGLKASAIKKTLYLVPGQDDEFTLVMFAESLGKYPPNTGLLVIRDGDDVYNLRFSSDFQKNAGIVFKKKK